MDAIQTKTITILGVGWAGTRIVGALSRMPEASGLRLLAMDTDREAFEECNLLPPEQLFLADEKWRHGHGCGGDVIQGQRSIARERANLEKFIGKTDLLIVVAGLGGGTGSAAVPVLAGVTGKARIPAIFMMTLPFAMEGHSKRKVAEDTIAELKPVADVAMCLPNDLLFSVLSAETSAGAAYLLANQELARSVVSVAEIMRVRNLLPMDFSDLREVLKDHKSFCALGVGLADLEEDSGLPPWQLALERMLEAPLLGGVNKLRDADVVILTMLGGEALSLGDMRSAFDSMSRLLGEESKLIIGANIDANYGNKIQLAALAVKYMEPVALPKTSNQANAPASSSRRRNVVRGRQAGSGQFEQMGFVFDEISRGIFLNTTPVIYNGEDLDIPTYQRQGVTIDRGDL